MPQTGCSRIPIRAGAVPPAGAACFPLRADAPEVCLFRTYKLNGILPESGFIIYKMYNGGGTIQEVPFSRKLYLIKYQKNIKQTKIRTFYID